MDYPPLPESAPRKSWTDRLQALFEVLLLSGLVSSFLVALPLSFARGKSLEFLMRDVRFVSIFLLLESGITFLLLKMMLRVHRETIQSLGCTWDRWKRNLSLGLALVPLLFLINALVLFAFRVYLPRYYTEHNPLTEIIHTPQQLALFIFTALVAGGVKEELQRAFILNKFHRYLGGGGVGLVLWSLAFGAGHYVQGAQGIVIAAVYGFIFGLVYLMSGNLVAPIVAHGAYDTLALLGYWLYSGPR
jgi:membrane protease YdiL (CAAX protease family)